MECSQEIGQKAELGEDKRSNRTRQNYREQTERWNQMTALRSQTGGRHQKRPASLRTNSNGA